MLKGKHIKLRALEPQDADLLFNWENDYELWRVSDTFKPFSKNIIKTYIDNESLDIFQTKQIRLMVDLINTEQTIGMIDMFDYDPFHNRAGIGIMIHKNFRTNGFASDALNILCNYAFKHLNIHQLYCSISKNNTPSLKLFEKLNFIKIGTKKDWVFNGKNYEDVFVFQKINPEHCY